MSKNPAEDDWLRELHETARGVEGDGWLDAQRWSQTRSLAEAVRIYREVVHVELPRLADMLAAAGVTLEEALSADPEPGSPRDRLQEVALHVTTAIGDGMTRLPAVQPIVVDIDVLRSAGGWTVQDDWPMLAELPQLPYEVIYLDFASEDYEIPMRTIPAESNAFPGWTAPLYGALAWRDDDCLGVLPMRGLTPPDASEKLVAATSAPQGLFKVLIGPSESVEADRDVNSIGISTDNGELTVSSQFEPSGHTQLQQEALVACWLVADVVAALRVLDDRRVHLHAAVPQTMSTVDSGSVTPMFAVWSTS